MARDVVRVKIYHAESGGESEVLPGSVNAWKRAGWTTEKPKPAPKTPLQLPKVDEKP
jgi:3-mercaptopyruvate sulfurtransferase SseA